MSEKLRVIRQLCENWCYHDGKPADVIGEVLAVLDGVDEAPSNPKRLPPRDCLVLYECNAGHWWLHAVYNNQAWLMAIGGLPIDPSRVIDWDKLPSGQRANPRPDLA